MEVHRQRERARPSPGKLRLPTSPARAGGDDPCIFTSPALRGRGRRALARRVRGLASRQRFVHPGWAASRDAELFRATAPPTRDGCGAPIMAYAAGSSVPRLQVPASASDRPVHRGLRVPREAAGDRGGWRSARGLHSRCAAGCLAARSRVAAHSILEQRHPRLSGRHRGGDSERVAGPSPAAKARRPLPRSAGEVNGRASREDYGEWVPKRIGADPALVLACSCMWRGRGFDFSGYRTASIRMDEIRSKCFSRF